MAVELMARGSDLSVAPGFPRNGCLSSARVRAALAALASACLIALAAAPSSLAGPTSTKIVRVPGIIVPIPAAIPHEAGDMIDRRLIPDLRWIAARFPIYITDGYSGPRPGGGPKVGCMCHTLNSDHYNGLAVDIVPATGSNRCDASWAPITRLALWAEPTQGHPVAPFRWVGYDGDAGHGCGHHLHLSWDHAPAQEFSLATWISVFPTGPFSAAVPPAPPKPSGPRGGIQGGSGAAPPPAASGPSGGVGGREL